MNKGTVWYENSEATFVRAIQIILIPIKRIVESYVDDMAVHSDDRQTHLRDIKRYLTAIRDAGLTLILGKCEFRKNSVKYVGHIIRLGWHEPDPECIQAVVEMPRPVTKKQTHQVLGIFGFCRSYIPHFSTIAKPFNDLIGRMNQLTSEAHQGAFDELTDRLCRAPCLFMPDVNKPWFLQCDASGGGLAHV